jgi:hypothetical protein
MEDPLLKKPAGSGQGGSAYDFGEIQNVPIQDTIPIPMVSTFFNRGRGNERHQIESQALLAKANRKSNRWALRLRLRRLRLLHQGKVTTTAQSAVTVPKP